MENIQHTLQQIVNNCAALNKENVKQVLVMYEEKIHNIGDCCIRFDKLKYFRSFFNNASVDMNFGSHDNTKYIDGLLKNNPHLSSISQLPWSDISFERYDVIIMIAYDQQKVLQFFHENYGDAIRSGQFPLAVFSLAELILPDVNFSKYVFPVHHDFIRYAQFPGPGELYVSAEEQDMADRWLEQRGVSKGDELFIVLDSTLRREKLLNPQVYFAFLTRLLKRENSKLLVYDEGNLGKEEFYRAWLGDEAIKQMIFTKGRRTLREDICLLASRYTRMVFGPCTGLLHCASAIYNNYVNNGLPPEQAPLLVVYTGVYVGAELNAYTWWGCAPLVNCLMLKKRNNKKELALLHDLPHEQKLLNDSLPCSEFTEAILSAFVSDGLAKRSQTTSHRPLTHTIKTTTTA